MISFNIFTQIMHITFDDLHFNIKEYVNSISTGDSMSMLYNSYTIPNKLFKKSEIKNKNETLNQ